MPPSQSNPLSARVRNLLAGLVRRPAIVLVLALLGAPLVLSPFARVATGEDDAEAEGRDYAGLPDFPDSLDALATFARRFETFFDDQFPLRMPLVELSAAIRFRVFHVSPNPAVVIGQDGWFFDGVGKERVEDDVVRNRNHLADHLGQLRLSDEELAAWARVLEERRVVLAERGAKYVFALAPNKRMIYPEHLPEVLKALKRETRLEQLARYLPTHTRVPIVDLVGSLLAAKTQADAPLLFYKTDGHWNYYGAFVAYRALVDATNREFSGLLGPPLELSDFTLEYDKRWSHPRFTAQMGLRVFEPYVRLVAVDDNPLLRLRFKKGRPFRQVSERETGEGTLSFGRQGVGGIRDFPERVLHRERYRHVKGALRKPPAGVERLFVLGDSFIEKSFYLFAAHAGEVYGSREILGFPDRLLETLDPDVVIHVIVQAFALNEPPKNPESVRREYMRIEHARAKQTLFEADSEALIEEGDGLTSLAVPALDAAGNRPIVAAIKGSRDAPVSFESSARSRKRKKPVGGGTRFLELDPAHARAGGKLVFEATKRELGELRVMIRRFDEPD